MSLLHWPDEIERTPKHERDDCTKFSTSLRKTRSQLKTEMERLGVDEWRIEEVGGGSGDPGVVLRWIDDGVDYAAACDRHKTKTANLREVYLWVNETRMREQREVQTAEDAFAAARLPSGDEEAGVVVGEEPPHEILGVDPDADTKEIKRAYRDRAGDVHPDRGGSEEEFKQVKSAKEQMLNGVGGDGQ